MKQLFSVIGTAVLFVAASFGADVSGKWQAEMQGRDGEKRVVTYNFKADGDKLTGTMETPMGARDIEEGKITGDEITFVIKMSFNGNDMVMKYAGKVGDGEIKFTQETPRGKREFVAKRATS